MVIRSCGGIFFPCSKWKYLQRIQYGNIQPLFFNNGIEGMGVGICQDAAAAVLVAVGGRVGGKWMENRYNNDK